MSFRVLGRVVVAASLVAASAGLIAASPVGATNTAITVTCPSPQSPQSINNGDTITWTVSTGCIGVGFASNPNPNANQGTLTVNGVPLAAGGFLPQVAQGSTVVYTAPGTGVSTDFIYFSGNGPGGQAEFPVSAPPTSGSFVDNGDGSATVTYSGLVVLFLFAQGSICPSDLSNVNGAFLYVVDSYPGAPVQLASSPAIISAGTSAMAGGIGPSGQADPNSLSPSVPPTTQIAAGSYQACLYNPVVAPGALLQGGVVNLGVIVDPVAPTFTG